MKIVFCSANCLLDQSSGAAISVKTLLELLAAQGVTCTSFTGSHFDSPSYATVTENLQSTGAHLDGTPGQAWLWSLKERAVSHFVVASDVTLRRRLGADMERQLAERALAYIGAHEPDVVMVYGDGIFERTILKKARSEGIATTFYLANPSYRSLDPFEYVDQVLTDSGATQRLYAQRLGLSCYTIGKFIAPPAALGEPATAPYVTFINPSAEKGVTLFARILELAARTTPSLHFLVVESRATLEAAQRRTGFPFSEFTSLRRIGLQQDMAGVYALTRILLVPSVWHESGGRVAIEACSLGIPAVVSRQGGLPEVMGEAGIIIAPPEPLVANHWLIPPVSEAIPWVEAVRQLWTDKEFYEDRRQAALMQWKSHEPSKRIAALIGLLGDLSARARDRASL